MIHSSLIIQDSNEKPDEKMLNVRNLLELGSNYFDSSIFYNQYE
jgi:hypothetical protein